MKTVSKKLLSLLLVAMLLVSAVPFQAFAASAVIRYPMVINATVDGAAQTITIPTGASSVEELNAWAECSAKDIVEFAQENEKLTGIDLETATITGSGSVDGESVVFNITITTGNTTGGTTGGTSGGETSKVTMTLSVYDKNDNKVESKTAQVDAADALAWQDDVMDNITDILAAFGSSFSAADVASGFANSNQVVLMLITASNPADGDNVVADVILKTDYCGNIRAKAGQKYLDVLPTPAKPGQEFAYWYSENLGGIVKAGDIIEASDVLTAYWQSPTKYNLTLDPNRGIKEDVNYGVQVAYGEEIYAKVMRYQPEREGYVFVGWKLNGKIIDSDDIYELQGDATAYATWKLESDTEDEPMGGTTHEKTGKVYLEIYVNGNTSEMKNRIDITSLAADDKVTRTEVENVVKKYVTPKAGYTLSYEGLFDEDGWWWYTRDPETNGKSQIVVNRDGDDYIYVMVKNVKIVASDPTNPKTGDYVLSAAMTMMMVSGLAAAAVYVIGKKRRA